MPRPPTPPRWIAWLALAALALLMAAPVISRTMAAPAWTEPGGWCGTQPDHPHGAPLEACGYCGLLGDSLPLPAGPVSPALPPPAPTAVMAVHGHRPAPNLPWLAARPRGPPGAAHS